VGVVIVKSLQEAGLKVLSNIISYKMWILGLATWLLMEGKIENWHWFAIAMIVLGARGVQDAISARLKG
jgi:hypothetical protein